MNEKSSGSRSRKQRLTAVGTRCADHVTPLYPQMLALTSPTDGGRSVGIVRVRTKATEFSFEFRNWLGRIFRFVLGRVKWPSMSEVCVGQGHCPGFWCLWERRITSFEFLFKIQFFFCGVLHLKYVLCCFCLRFLGHTQLDTQTHTRTHCTNLLKRVIRLSLRPLPTQHTTNIRDEKPCSQGDSNPRSQKSSNHRPTSQTTLPPVSADVACILTDKQ